MRNCIISFCMVLLAGLLALAPAVDAQAKQIKQSFTLPPVDGTPVTLQIPLAVGQAGSVTATVTLDVKGLLPDKTLYIALHQSGNRYPLASRYYDRLTPSLYLRYDISPQEYAAGQSFSLELINYSRERTLNGKIEINYPVAGETRDLSGEAPPPNLAVGKLFLDEQCKVQVSLKNLGPGALSKYFWKNDMPELRLYKDGEEWGVVDIRFFDYNQALRQVGGEVIYNSGLKIFGSALVKVEVLTPAGLHEASSEDNVQELMLTCE